MSEVVSETRGRMRDRLFAWYWARRARRAKNLAAFRRELLRRRGELDRIALRTERRLAKSTETGDETAIWRLRPEIFSARQNPSIWSSPISGAEPAGGLAVFHNASEGAFTLSQRPNRGGAERFELFYESYDFDGDYLSLVFAVPDALRRPKSGETLALSLDCQASQQIKCFFRLNLSSMQRQDALNAEAMLGDGPGEIAFDLSFAAFDPQEAGAIWLDLIFDRPRMVEISIRALELRLIPAGEA